MNVKVNAGEWQTLSANDQKKVQDILLATGLLKGGDNLTPDAAAPASGKLAAGIFDDLKKPVCQAACTAAEGVAVGACAGVSGGLLVAICMAAAHTAAEECRNRC